MMSNNLAIKNVDIQDLNDEELELLHEKVLNAKLKNLAQKVNEANLVAKKAENKAKAANEKIADLEEKQEEQKQIAVNSMRVNAPKYDWVTQTKFGEFLEPSIGSQTIGKLLKTVGLAKQRPGRTVPYRKYIGESKYARIRTFENYSTTDWHYEKCLDFIDDWLEDKNLYNEFYSTESEEARKEFIDQIYNAYVGN